MNKRKATERTIAGGLSIGAHGLILWMLFSGLRDEPPPPEAQAIQMTLLPPERPPSPAVRPKEAAPASAAPERSIVQAPAPPAPLAAEVESGVETAPAPSPGASAGSAPGLAVAGPPSALDFTCVVKNMKTMTPSQRRNCLGQGYASPAPRRVYGLMIPAEKKAEYDAVAGRQAYKRRWPSQFGNAPPTRCPHSNLGSGCLDDILVPIVTMNSEGGRLGKKDPK